MTFLEFVSFVSVALGAGLIGLILFLFVYFKREPGAEEVSGALLLYSSGAPRSDDGVQASEPVPPSTLSDQGLEWADDLYPAFAQGVRVA